MSAIRPRITSSTLTKFRPLSRLQIPAARPFNRYIPTALLRQRLYSTETSPFPSLPHGTELPSSVKLNTDGSNNASFPLAEKPSYELTFTCKPCSHRATHKVSKQGYHKGTVLIQCPGCKARHLIADHLKIFRDQSTTLEDIMREQGEKIQKGFKSANGDVEILPPDEEAEEDVMPAAP